MHSFSVNKLSKIDATFGHALKKTRLLKKYIQEELSIQAGLSRAYISELEMGHKDPSLFTIFKLARAMKIKISNLLEGVEAIN